MSTTDVSTDELRVLVRRALLGMLQREQFEGAPGSPVDGLADLVSAPPEQEIRMTVRGSQRAISLLEDAVRAGETTLEIGIGAKWGPKVRVRVDGADA